MVCFFQNQSLSQNELSGGGAGGEQKQQQQQQQEHSSSKTSTLNLKAGKRTRTGLMPELIEINIYAGKIR